MWRILRRKTRIPTAERVFWESHDPTQGMRQGNDVGTQHRSGLYSLSEVQKTQAQASRWNEAPLRHEVGERKGPIAKQWEGEVVPDTDSAKQLRDTSPSPRFARVPSLSPR